MQIQDIQFKQLMELLALVLVVVGAYNIIMNAIKTRREERRLRNSPITKINERLDRHDKLFAKDKDRLDLLETEFADVSDATRILLRHSMAVNDHMISGNDISKLKDSSVEIRKYLLNRR